MTQLHDDFDTFFRLHLARVVGFLLKQGATVEDAQDAAQEGFKQAYQKWTSIDYPRAFVYRVASNAYIRQQQRRRNRFRHETSTTLPHDHVTCTVDFDLREQEKAVIEALAALPRRQSEVMAWHLDGFSHREIAESLGISHQAVRASFYQARHTLKKTLFAAHQDGEDS